ncbi:MAG: SGNH/GDSL hydrolase family protein [Bacteroidota bacterium]
MFRILSLLLILLSFFSCQNENTEPSTTDEPKKTYTYLALGDSYTIGESVARDSTYPALLSADFEADSIIVDYKIVATTGWTTDELNAGINQEKPSSDYDMVSLLIGVNNQFRERDTSVYAQEFEDLLQRAIVFAQGETKKVFVVSIPDYAFTSYGQSEEADTDAITKGINDFNAINKRITTAYNIAYFDITPISRNGLDDTALVASDGLHPSGAQYALWVDLMYDEVKELLLEE